MNLVRLFETQKILRDRINYDEPDRFNKLVLALLVEIGECANEWRGFKFWSKDQEPRTIAPISKNKLGGWVGIKNPLLEEYVDGLHFVLELGIELEIDVSALEFNFDKSESIVQQFIDIQYLTTNLHENQKYYAYEMLVEAYLELGEMLGFTWEQIESAYYAKNEINHQRQDSGTY